jgi:hypothetical protein
MGAAGAACMVAGVGVAGYAWVVGGGRGEAPHVFLEWAFVAEGIVTGCGELAEPAVEAGWWAVTLDGGMWTVAVS